MTVPKNASFDPIDGCYKCECGQLLRLNAGLGYVISVNSCDSSVESVASYDEHVCSAKSQKRPAENYLQAQQKEIELQRELYGKFEPRGIFDKNREYQLKQ